MSDLLMLLWASLIDTVLGLVPIVAVLGFFQLVVLRKPLKNPRRIAVGMLYVVAGMTLFLTGLGEALFPLGRSMAEQLVPRDIGAGGAPVEWTSFGWIYLFGALIGFATTVAEPALIAVSLKAQEVSRGGVNALALRFAVAVGVAIGIAVGCFRIVTGTSLPAYIIVGYVIVSIQAWRAPKDIVALAFDTGGVTTSTVTVPIVAALGLGLASSIPGRSPLIDGFGLIAFASLFPMMTVMAYAQIAQGWAHRQEQMRHRKGEQQAERAEGLTSAAKEE